MTDTRPGSAQERPPDVTCPWCDAVDVERVGEFGPTAMTEQWLCRRCGSPFERMRLRGDAPEG